MHIALQEREAELKGELYGLKLKLRGYDAGRSELDILTDTGEPDIWDHADALTLPARLTLYKREDIKEYNGNHDKLVEVLYNVIFTKYRSAVKVLDDIAAKGEDAFGPFEGHIEALRLCAVISEAWRDYYELNRWELQMSDDKPPKFVEWLTYQLKDEKPDPRVIAMVDDAYFFPL